MSDSTETSTPTPLDTLDRELETAFPPGGAPAAAAPEPSPAELLDEATMKMFLAVPFDFIAARKGEHWKLSPEESAALVPLACKVANKYAPAMLARWADELALAAIAGMILLKRVNHDAEKAKAEKKETPAAPGGGGGGGEFKEPPPFPRAV